MDDLLSLLGVDEKDVATQQKTGQQIARAQAHAVDPRRDLMHVCLPNMAYVCDGGPLGLADGGPAGKRMYGVGNRWDQVTCPECRAPGHREVSRRTHLQQKPVGHECPPLHTLDETPDNLGCRHWQTIPEGE